MRKFTVNLGKFLENHEIPSFLMFWEGKELSKALNFLRKCLCLRVPGAEAVNPCKIGGILGKQLNSCDFNGKSAKTTHFMGNHEIQ